MPSPSSPSQVAYLLFDVEAVADAQLVADIRYPKDGLEPKAALARYRAELMEQNGKDILPATFMLPCAVAVAKVSGDYRLLDVVALDEPKYRPHVITRTFWQGWRHYNRPVLVTFNGRGYDLPVMELAAFRYGYSVPEWFNVHAISYEQSRNRYNINSHVDLMDLVSNFGASRVSGGLNLLANLIGKPGKTSIDGSKVQDMHDSGQDKEINDYCRCDVLDTYFVFLRTRVMIGRLTLDDEQKLVAEARTWLETQAVQTPAYRHYLDHWGDWHPPVD